MTVVIRPEQPNDLTAIRHVHTSAFPAPSEADLVDALRAADHATVSLVAANDDHIVGHILFSPVTLTTDDAGRAPLPWGLGLAPMAVLPAHQRTGVGALLVKAGLERCRELGHPRVVVLGHPTYYPRFGFRPASEFGLRSTYNVPDDVFMAQALAPGALEGWSGVVHYAPTFEQL